MLNNLRHQVFVFVVSYVRVVTLALFLGGNADDPQPVKVAVRDRCRQLRAEEEEEEEPQNSFNSMRSCNLTERPTFPSETCGGSLVFRQPGSKCPAAPVFTEVEDGGGRGGGRAAEGGLHFGSHRKRR